MGNDVIEIKADYLRKKFKLVRKKCLKRLLNGKGEMNNDLYKTV